MLGLMKGPVFSRLFGLFCLYAVVLSLLVLIQFTRKTAFTMNVGSMVISGNYSDPEISENNLADGSMLLGGPASVYFGGMEFVLPDRTEQKLVSMSSDASQILFSFSDNSTIRFSTAFSGGSESMSIQAEFEEESRELEIGFRPLRSSRIIDDPDSSLSILSEEQEYGFLFGPVRVDKRTIVLNIDDTLLSYGVIPNTEEFSPASFILSSVSEQDQYQQYLQSWINQQYAQWERSMAGNPAEESVIAYIAESARRNNYRSAAASIPDTFKFFSAQLSVGPLFWFFGCSFAQSEFSRAGKSWPDIPSCKRKKSGDSF